MRYSKMNNSEENKQKSEGGLDRESLARRSDLSFDKLIEYDRRGRALQAEALHSAFTSFKNWLLGRHHMNK